jgi:hypothetical protein
LRKTRKAMERPEFRKKSESWSWAVGSEQWRFVAASSSRVTVLSGFTIVISVN